MKPLSRELTSQYDLNIKKYQYVRSNYYLETNKGKFVLRKVDTTKDQIEFCYELDMHLKNNGFMLLNSIYTTRKKIPYAMLGEDVYIMHHYVTSDETDFKSREDLNGIICTLAQFHEAAQNMESKQRDINSIKIKNIYEYYIKRQNENNKLRKNILSFKQKSNFELMFLTECDVYRHLEDIALGTINKELSERLIKQVLNQRTVAHKDFTYHTVNKSSNKEYIISNLDTCNYYIQILDVAQILSKMMQKNEWDNKLLYELVDTYNKWHILSRDEMQMLKFTMIYPEKYNSICYRYISSKRRWNYSMFEQKWENMLAYKDKQIQAAKIIETW